MPDTLGAQASRIWNPGVTAYASAKANQKGSCAARTQRGPYRPRLSPVLPDSSHPGQNTAVSGGPMQKRWPRCGRSPSLTGDRGNAYPAIKRHLEIPHLCEVREVTGCRFRWMKTNRN